MNEEKNIEEVLQDLEKASKYDINAWVITYHGKAISLANGKHVWKAQNHAKSALANHCATLYGGYPYERIKKMGFNRGTELAQYLVNTGIVKVEQL